MTGAKDDMFMCAVVYMCATHLFMSLRSVNTQTHTRGTEQERVSE